MPQVGGGSSSKTPWVVLGVVVLLGVFLFMKSRGASGGITALPQPNNANATQALAALAPVAQAEISSADNAKILEAQFAAQTAAINASIQTAQINAGVQENASNRQAQTQQGSSLLGTIATIGGALIGALL